MKNKIIEVFIFNYNGTKTVLSTIESLYNSVEVDIKIAIIDDHSTDNSLEMIKTKYPEIQIHVMPVNYKKINVLRNKALELATSEFVFITDNDLLFDERCIVELLKVMQSDDNIATCTPRLMYWDHPNKVYTAGTRVHFIGTSIADMRDKIYNENSIEPSTNSGSGIMLIRLYASQKVGGFDVNFLMGWGNDGEFYQRLMRAGYKCLYIPSAFALHEDKLVVTNRKFRVIGQTYNRWVFILSHYSVPLIILLIPAFIIYEFFQLGFVLMKGLFPQYLKGNLNVIKNLPFIVNKRKEVQKLKVVSDKEVLFSGDIYVAPALIEKHRMIKYVIKSFSAFLNTYWILIKKIIP